jgi:large repetitive protein
MTLALSWALVAGCAAITDAELADRLDRDGDGDVAAQWGGNDCDDQDPQRNDEAVEICNGIDDDCSGKVDDVASPEGETFYFDLDHDDVGGEAIQACEQPNQTVRTGGDCDDDDALVHPGVAELCNGIDDDCDGLIDFEDDLETPSWYGDADGDGYGLDTVIKIVAGCEPPKGYAAAGGDCDDRDAAVNPDGQEVCNEHDDDCDELVDAADDSLDGNLYYPDADNDGFGSAVGAPVVACSEPFGHELGALDCDDADAAVNPDAIEVCNGRDDNCVDEEEDAIDRTVWYLDGDGDEYGGPVSVESCEPPKGAYVRAGGDCDDGDVAYNPGADECGEILDYNCDGSTGEVDLDGDEYDAGCDDCNDADPAINPAATEVCDAAGVDENCNGVDGDEDDSTSATSKTLWYPDVDGDHYGNENAIPDKECNAPPSTVADNSDCDDGDDTVRPGAVEIWYDTIDQNCDELSDFDRDFDGYEAESEGSIDCDDANASVYPGAPDEWYSGVDENCDDADDYDKDGDGYKSAAEYTGGTDCNDENGAINPGATENALTLSIDEDCDGNAIF